ncbi:TetR/AcrR family transcriptional regulator [Paenibacillus arenosi]|uniref:TetR/AcrR family transcriptional regulator n=1 Tax=Paenibacillus arenosi TaxID=2774142 RepID=A0ABR9ATY4_9BACL|nr:TetR/AcrR family transcriptional regulator [Paenibacillus arenosi]MBD8497168.1 TetR/AcrR family transcriptional regulator [Paenibacillus arenosi]
MRKRVLACCMELLAVRGLKFTTAELANSLGISKRTLYEQFESKEAIIACLVDDAIEEIRKHEREIYAREDWNAAQKLYALLSFVPSGLLIGNPHLLEDLKRYAPMQWSKVDQLLLHEWSTITKVLEDGIASGEFRSVHVPAVVQAMRGASAAIFDPREAQHVAFSLHQAVKTMTDVFVQGLIHKGD